MPHLTATAPSMTSRQSRPDAIPMLDEEQAEIMALTDLATNLSDGMASLTASNIGRPIKNAEAS